MKAQELRIGNKLKKDGVIVTIDGRSIFDIWSSELGFGNHAYEPIPLTEEWLLRAGFKPLSQGYWHNDVIQVGYTTTDEFIQYEYLTGVNGSNTEMLDLKHVHQLQNLYFALTGEELNFTVSGSSPSSSPRPD